MLQRDTGVHTARGPTSSTRTFPSRISLATFETRAWTTPYCAQGKPSQTQSCLLTGPKLAERRSGSKLSNDLKLIVWENDAKLVPFGHVRPGVSGRHSANLPEIGARTIFRSISYSRRRRSDCATVQFPFEIRLITLLARRYAAWRVRSRNL